MARKKYCRETFTAMVNGVEIRFYAWTTDTYSGFCETVSCDSHNITDTKVSWCGRSWQRFDYEVALKKAIAKLPKELQDGAHRQLIDKVSEEKEEKANAMVNRFQKIYNDCSPRQKEMLAKSNIQMNSESDVRAVEGLMLLGQLMGV